MKTTVSLILLFSSGAFASSPYDDAHNHDGTHVDGAVDCGSNYMLPGEVARLGSHSFMIVGQDDASHIIVEHRSGTPPHNYQFLLRVRLDADEMKNYQEILKDSKTLPAFTTIFFDEKGEQKDRTFFCLQDLPKIFGNEKKAGDQFDKLFPIRASLQKNPDHEGSFEIKKSVVLGKYFSLNRDDIEILVYRYLPSYLPQDTLRTILKKDPKIGDLLDDHPLFATEPADAASKRKISYMTSDGIRGSGKLTCKKNYYLNSLPVKETIHTFMLFPEESGSVLAVHYYDYAPQNFQTILRLKVSPAEFELIKKARANGDVPLLQTSVNHNDQSFCMDGIRSVVADKKFALRGAVFSGNQLNDYKLGKEIGNLKVSSDKISVLVNRKLESFMNPLEVRADVGKVGLGKAPSKGGY